MALRETLRRLDGLRKLHTCYWVYVRMPIWRVVATTRARFGYRKSLKRLRAAYETRKLRVAFIVSELPKWKGQSVYDLMKESLAYEPFMAVIPSGAELECLDSSGVERAVRQKVDYFKDRHMSVVSAWDALRHRVVDVQKIDVDILFYQQPWDTLGALAPHRVSSRALTFYFSYYMLNNLNLKLEVGEEFHRTIYGYIVNSAGVARMFRDEQRKLGFAHVPKFLPLGHPMMDNFHLCQNLIENQGYVIYAPHWTIVYGNHRPLLHYSTFLENGSAVLDYARRHPQVKWVFRPHPALRKALMSSGAMSKIQIDNYYQAWEQIGIGWYSGDYVDLFLSSRALITDCGSFLTEYAATGNPLVRLISKDINVSPHPSLVEVYASYYQVHDLDELQRTLDAVVLRGEDPIQAQRLKAVTAAGLMGTHAAKNIVDYLDRLLSGEVAETK